MGSGGGGSQTTTVDPVYNAGMLKLSQEQQGWANEMFNQFKYGVAYDPNEQLTGAYVNGKWVNEADLPKIANPDYRPAYSRPQYEWTRDDRFNNVLQEIPGTAMTHPAVGSPQINDPQYQIQTISRGEAEGYSPNNQISEMQYLQDLVNANADLLGLQTDYSKAELNLGKEGISAQRELLPLQTGLSKQQLAAQRELLPLQTGLSKQQFAAQRELLPLQTELEKRNYGLGLKGVDLAEQKLEVEGKRTAFGSDFLDEIGQGIDVGKRMDQAQAGVQHGYKNARESIDKNIFSRGLDASSGQFTAANRDLALSEASGIAGARTQAAEDADREDFNRKVTGLSLNY